MVIHQDLDKTLNPSSEKINLEGNDGRWLKGGEQERAEREGVRQVDSWGILDSWGMSKAWPQRPLYFEICSRNMFRTFCFVPPPLNEEQNVASFSALRRSAGYEPWLAKLVNFSGFMIFWSTMRFTRCFDQKKLTFFWFLINKSYFLDEYNIVFLLVWSKNIVIGFLLKKMLVVDNSPFHIAIFRINQNT
jgi:hypothetical protein